MSDKITKTYIPGPHVDRRYKVCSRTRNRWKKDPKLGFPQPMIINNREFYEEDELDEFDRRCARASCSTQKAA